MRKLHVVIATGLYPPEIGGPATFAAFFEKELQARGIACTVVPFSTVRHLPKGVRHIVYFARVLLAIRKGSRVLALDPVSVGLPALLAARLRFAPFYLRAGGDYAWEQAAQRWGFTGLPEEFPGDAKLPLAAKTLVWAERFVARGARRVLTQSGHLASIAARWGIDREKIAVVPNSVLPPSLPSRVYMRRELEWEKDPVIISAGRFVPWKGFLALMDAAASLAREFPDISLKIAGSGPQESDLKAHASKLPVSVVFLGDVPKAQLMHMIRAADVFALNTRYEGFSHQILEAMSVETPVVTTDIPGNADLAEDGKTALTVRFDDTNALASAIRRILTDKLLAGRLAHAAQVRAHEFTPERTFTETCRAIDIALPVSA